MNMGHNAAKQLFKRVTLKETTDEEHKIIKTLCVDKAQMGWF